MKLREVLAEETMPKYVKIGFSEKPIPLDELEPLLTEFEERIRRYIRSKVGRRIDELEIIVEASIDEDNTLTVKVDASITGRFIAPYSYDEVLAEAIEEAGNWLESKLRQLLSSSDKEEREDNK